MTNNLGIFYEAQDRFDDAVTMYERVLAFREKRLGDDDPETRKVLMKLTKLYRAQGRHADAELTASRVPYRLPLTISDLFFFASEASTSKTED